MNKEAQQGKQSGALREKRVVLVVDGDPVSQFHASVFLQRLNYHVFPVRSAEEALMIIELTTPLLVITEITLPKMSGVDLLKQIKHDPRTRGVPVLIYTAVKAGRQRDQCIQAGCAGYLLHTSDHNQLYEAVQKATESKPRHFVRLATWLDVVVTARGIGDQAALVTAISEHGMYVSARQPLPKGTAVEFTLHLPNAGAGGISLQGKVLYSHANPALGRNPGMGVKFLRVRPDDDALIKAFIEKELMKEISGKPSAK